MHLDSLSLCYCLAISNSPQTLCDLMCDCLACPAQNSSSLNTVRPLVKPEWCGGARLLSRQPGAQVFVPSKDGSVKIPMFIVHHKDVVLDGLNPTYLYAYGGAHPS